MSEKISEGTSEWLAQPCEIVKDNPDGSQFIPIGIVEQTLDKFVSWSTSDFKFQIFKTGDFYFASGSLLLTITNHYGKSITRVGAYTMPINRTDQNMDYEATVLSFCLANAAKKLGKRFGRHLNGRLEVGETAALPVIKVDKKAEADAEYESVKDSIENAQSRTEAFSILANSSFRYNHELKLIAESKK